VGDVRWKLNPALRCPQGSGYNTCVREHPRVPPRLRWIFSHNPVFFVTCCTQRRRKLLATDAVHAAFLAFAIQAYSRRNIAVGRYVIMPDHLHLFVCGPDNFELGRWMGTLKQYLGKRIAASGSTSQSGNAAFSIIFCAAMKATRKNGITFARIQFATDWSMTQTPGPIPERSC
jgi:REP element-mobilizing transposase RayT